MMVVVMVVVIMAVALTGSAWQSSVSLRSSSLGQGCVLMRVSSCPNQRILQSYNNQPRKTGTTVNTVSTVDTANIINTLSTVRTVSADSQCTQYSQRSIQRKIRPLKDERRRSLLDQHKRRNKMNQRKSKRVRTRAALHTRAIMHCPSMRL